MSDYAELLKRLDHYANSIQQGVHISGTQMRRLLLELRAVLVEQQEEDSDTWT